MCTGRKRVQIPLLYMGVWGRKGDRPYYQRVPKLLNSYNVAWGQGESDRIWFSLFLHSKTLLIHFVLRPWDTTVCTLASHSLDLYLFLHDCPLFTKPRKKKKIKDSSF